MKKDPSFKDHMRRFNLPVYYEIRFQQIDGNFEKYMLSKPSPEIYNANQDVYCLKITTALLEAISRCFESDVFLEHLSDQFIKLSMLLLSRYLKWFDTIFSVRL